MYYVFPSIVIDLIENLIYFSADIKYWDLVTCIYTCNMCIDIYAADVGQRVHVGKVNMDHESTAITTHQSVEETRKYVAIALC